MGGWLRRSGTIRTLICGVDVCVLYGNHRLKESSVPGPHPHDIFLNNRLYKAIRFKADLEGSGRSNLDLQ